MGMLFVWLYAVMVVLICVWCLVDTYENVKFSVKSRYPSYGDIVRRKYKWIVEKVHDPTEFYAEPYTKITQYSRYGGAQGDVIIFLKGTHYKPQEVLDAVWLERFNFETINGNELVIEFVNIEDWVF